MKILCASKEYWKVEKLKPREIEPDDLKIVNLEVKIEKKFDLWSIVEGWSSADFDEVLVGRKGNHVNSKPGLWAKILDGVCKGNGKKRRKRKKNEPDKKPEVDAGVEVLGMKNVDMELENKIKRRKKRTFSEKKESVAGI
jgi:hypothetical protein